MKTQKKIAIFTTIEGHESIADAIRQQLKAEYQISWFQQTDSMMKYYQSIYMYFPSLFKVPFTLGKNEKIQQAIHDIYRLRYEKKLEEFYLKHQPDLCINTYFVYTPLLERFASIGKTPFINVLTDPRSIHPILISPKAVSNLVFDSTAQEYCQELNSEAPYQRIGWFVRPEFSPVNDRAQIRKKLRLVADQLTFLMAAGSEGTTTVLKILPLFLNTPCPVQVVVACGKNDTLYNGIVAFQKVLAQMKSKNTLIPLRFTKKIHQYMQAADLVIGKAGPNMLFESVATNTPFFAITHVAGQEDGNLDIIRDYHLGYVEENPLKAVKELRQILSHPEKLVDLQPALRKMAEYNHQATAKLQTLIQKSLLDQS